MIKPGKNRKRCKINGCESYIFSHGYCKFHFNINKGAKPVKRVATKKRQKTIRRISDKKRTEEILYNQAKENIRNELLEKGEFKCFFSNKDLPSDYNLFHHLKGRVGTLVYDEEFMVPALNEYHLKYHDLSVAKLQKEEWYNIFLENLKTKNIVLYEKEINKRNK
jgi:hypothetical protein